MSFWSNWTLVLFKFSASFSGFSLYFLIHYWYEVTMMVDFLFLSWSLHFLLEIFRNSVVRFRIHLGLSSWYIDPFIILKWPLLFLIILIRQNLLGVKWTLHRRSPHPFSSSHSVCLYLKHVSCEHYAVGSFDGTTFKLGHLMSPLIIFFLLMSLLIHFPVCLTWTSISSLSLFFSLF